MAPVIRLADDVALLILADTFAELLPISPRAWGWRFESGAWFVFRIGEA